MATEEYFPRGGKKPTSTPYFKQSNFLGNTGDKKKRRFNNRKQPRPDDGYLSEVSDHEFDKAQIICAETLSLSVLQNGVLLLGRIKGIFDTKVIVSLPAKMYGIVMACHISVPYNKCLQAYVDDEIEEIQSMSSLFQKGEYVVVKVIQVTTDNKNQVMLSMMPQDINKEFNISKVQKGVVLRGAIESKEDHGYVVDLGIKDCHAFMPLKMVDESCNLAVGQVIWCTVTKSDNPNVIKVSNKIEILRDAVVKQKHDSKTLDCILPGMAVEFNIKQALPNGIEGQFFGDLTGYILRTQVDLVKGKKPHIGEKIKARLLYVLPTTKLSFFTMKNIFENLMPNLEEENKLAVGQFVENAKVIKVTGRSIIFRLGSECVGMMTLKHIKVDLDLDDEDVIQKSYPLGSEHKVRILNYYLCDYMYECTDDKQLLNEKVLSYDDLSTGQIVDATVTEIRDNGIQLKVGCLHGFVPTIQLSDVGLSVQKKKGTLIKNKFKIGQPVRARVLTLNPERNRLILTLKSSLLDPEMEVLKSYNDAVVGKRYKGVIVSVGIRIVVSFFEDVRAMVSPTHVSREPIKDLSSAFHVGEIALCTILKVEPENQRMLVSFTQTPFEDGQEKQVVTDDSKINNKKRKIGQLSDGDSVDSGEFVNSVLTEEDAECTDERQLLNEEVLSYDDLSTGQIVDATVTEIRDNGIQLKVGCLQGFVPTIQLSDDQTLTKNKFKVGQPVRARVLTLNPRRKRLILTLKSSLLDPDMKVLKNYNDAVVGKRYKGVIVSVGVRIVVSFFEDVRAMVSPTHVSREPIKDLSSAFHVGEIALCTILKVEPENQRMLVSFTHAPLEDGQKKQVVTGDSKIKNKKRKTEQLSDGDSVDFGELVSTVLTEKDAECTDERKPLNDKVLSYDDLSTGQIVDATVTEIRDNGIQLKVGGLQGFVPTIQLSDDQTLTKNKLKIGQPVRARVLTLNPQRKRLILTLKSSLLDPDMEVLKNYNDAVVGKRYKGVIVSVGVRIVVSFFEDVRAMVSPTHVSLEPIKDLSSAFHVGEIALCTILKVEPENQRMLVSFTHALFEDGEKKQVVTDDSKINNKKRKIEQVEPTGERNKTKKSKKQQQSEVERLALEELSEVDSVDFGEFVSAVLTEKDAKLLDVDSCITKKKCKKRVVSLIKSINKKLLKVNKFEEVLEKIENKGITTRNKQLHTNINANKLILQEHINTFMEKVTFMQNKFKEFPPDEIELPKAKAKKVKENKVEKKNKDVDYDSGVIDDINMDDDDFHSALRTEVEEPAVNESKKLKKKKSKKNKKDDSIEEVEEPSLTLPSVKDFWTASVQTKAATNSSSDSSDEEEVEVQPKKKKKLSAAEKVEKARQEEEKIRELEKQTILTDNQPRSSDQFERLLLANPDSSELWIAYMAFYLQGTEIDKARAVGRRALKVISFREEHEKLNVWLAMLNFENSFGTKESQDKTMEEALQMNDPIEVHLKMLEIYAETNKVDELSSLVDLVMRKYKGKPRVYVSAGNACYKCNLIDKGRFVMQKAIATLEKKEHVAAIVQFAKMERQYGEAERAEALLEQIVGVYPQRVDVWCVYVDMLIKSSDINNIRQVMERAVSHRLPARKMKTLFKKWIDIEERLGSKEKIEEIREKALNFINEAKF